MELPLPKNKGGPQKMAMCKGILGYFWGFQFQRYSVCHGVLLNTCYIHVNTYLYAFWGIAKDV